MERMFLQWNITNWITVVLMATFGFFALKIATDQIAKMRGQSNG